MEPGVLVRAGVVGMLVVLIMVGSACFGRPSPPPEPAVLREASPVSSPTPAPSPVAAVVNPSLIPAGVPSPVASPVGAPRVRVMGAGAEGVNLRAEPGANGARLKGLFDGAELELLGEDAEADGRTWRRVRDPADRSEGWVAAEFLGPGG